MRGSCHVPIVGGWLPYRVGPEETGEGGSGGGSGGKTHWYYDGLAWLTFLVPWRTFSQRSQVIKVSALSAPNADVCPRYPYCPLPVW